MLRKEPVKGKKKVKVTFVIDHREDLGKVSVVGDFNDWTPGVHRFVRRRNRTRSVAVRLPAGSRYRFRYLSEGWGWFNDDAADAYERGEYGADNCVVLT